MLISKFNSLIKADKSFEEIRDICNFTKSELLYTLFNYMNTVKDKDLSLYAEFLYYQNYVYKKYKSNSKFILWSDYHAGNTNECEKNLEMMYSYANKHRIRDIFFLGDLFDRNINNSSVYDSFDKLFDHLINIIPYNYFTTNYFLLGNHDYFYKLQGINLEKLLESSRTDFISMGYRNSFISIFNEIVSFRHPVSRYKNCNHSEINSSIKFLGHSHIYDFNFKYNGNYSIKVPACSNLSSCDKLHSEPGFLVLDIRQGIDNFNIGEILLSQMLFKNDKCSIKDRQKIKTSFEY